MDREQQRQNRRDLTSAFSCTADAELVPLQNPSPRPTAACDTPNPTPTPLPDVALVPCPPADPIPLNLPEGLVVASDPVTAFCPSTAGFSVTGTTAISLTAGAQNQVILFTALDEITENQLNYLYLIVPGASAAIISASLSGATSSVIDLTHLNYAQAEQLIIGVQDAKFTVNLLATDQARNLLVCQAENDGQIASCPTSAYFGSSAGVPTGLAYSPTAIAATGSVLVQFNLLSTTGDQSVFTALNIPGLTAAAAQANALALAQAESALRCVFGNSATSAACCTSQAPDNNLGYTVACVPATGPSITGIAPAVGYFTVAENTVFSAVSKDQADSVARELSRDSLNCYFPSDEITATCAGTGPTGLGKTGPFAPASTTAVTLPAGSIILSDLDSSVTAANDQAILIATASLNCFWSNGTATVFCPPSGTFTGINNIEYNLAASPTASLNYSSTVLANTVISYTSQEDANEQAEQLASANLSCIYCNNAVAPTCSGGVNETVGSSADLICNILGDIAQNTAISLGNILKSASEGGLNCCYGNDPVENTIECGTGAYFNSSPSASFTSVDSFFLPANVITICESTTAPPPPPLLFPYTNLFEASNINFGCCEDIYVCSGATGSATALPTLWATQTNLFDFVSSGATFYLDDEGTQGATFSPESLYIVSRAGSQRSYRGISGSSGYTEGLTACLPCSNLTSYNFKGATLGSYSDSSTSAAVTDIFCNGPTAQSITLYTDALNPFTSIFPSSWYTDPCGNTAFSPVVDSTTAARYVAGYEAGSTGFYIIFSTSGGNTASAAEEYSLSSCPASRYPYSVYPNTEACSTASGATTLYTSVPLAFTTNGATTINFYSQLFNDSSIYTFPGASGYVNYIAPDTSVYARPITGVTATAALTCGDLYRVTVQYSVSSADEVCNYPSFYSPTADGYFNGNIRTLWSTVSDPFNASASGDQAQFYTQPVASTGLLFSPSEASPGATVYVSEFSPGEKFRSAFREFNNVNFLADYKSYTGTFLSSPFVQSASGSSGASAVWLYSVDIDTICGSLTAGSRGLFNLSATCSSAWVYSDIKYPLTNRTALDASHKYLPLPSAPSDVLYSSSSNLLFDGMGYMLASGITGTVGSSAIAVTDFTKIGAAFTGAVVRTPGNYIGTTGATATVIPPFISSFDLASGIINLGGYFNKVNFAIPASTPLHVIGFVIDATGWGASSFICEGEHCDKIEVGHSLFSYYVGAEGTTFSAGYVNKVVGNTIYYTGAPSYNNFSSYDIGTGASHGSGRVYILGRQFASFWADDNKTSPINRNLNPLYENFIFKDESINYAGAKNLTLGTTAGATADFSVIGAHSDVCPTRQQVPQYGVTGPLYWSGSYYAYDTIDFLCDGTLDITVNIVDHFSVASFTSCCDVVYTDEVYASTASACVYNQTYPGVTADPDLSAQVVDIITTPGATFYYDSLSHSPLNDISFSDFIIQINGVGPFVRAFIAAGQLESFWPCNANDIGSTATYTRQFLGYFDLENNIYPSDNSVLLDNELYWSGTGKNNVAGNTGYVFKEFDPDLAAVTACNCGNFSFIDHDINSGIKYSIWPTATAAWESLSNPPYLNPEDPFLTASYFNECSTGCDETYTCINSTDCNNPAPAGFITSDSYSNDSLFNPSSFNPPSLFDFEAMPSVGGTAEDLKAEATEIAQNLVNSFVRCYYFNTFQTGNTCSNPTDITAQIGYAEAAEVVSNDSLAEANRLAKLLANSRTICLSQDVVGAGCENTEIGNASSSNNLGSLNLSFSKAGCNFTPNITFSSNIVFANATIRKITICSPTGASLDVYVPSIPDFPEGGTFGMAVANPS